MNTNEFGEKATGLWFRKKQCYEDQKINQMSIKDGKPELSRMEELMRLKKDETHTHNSRR